MRLRGEEKEGKEESDGLASRVAIVARRTKNNVSSVVAVNTYIFWKRQLV